MKEKIAQKKALPLVFFILFTLSLVSCSGKNIGWGVLLWAVEDPSIPSGTLLSIQIRSNIEQAWVVNVPEPYNTGGMQVANVPIPHLEFFRSRSAAERFAADFAEYSVIYAETVQDGLPIRDRPENNARRVYRLRQGEIIKILGIAEGVEAVSATGDPLEGDWYRVMTHSGSRGFCFSYRLREFEHYTGSFEKALDYDDIIDSEEGDQNGVSQSPALLDGTALMDGADFFTQTVSMDILDSTERERQQDKLLDIYDRGPRFSSINYGDLIINAGGSFEWDGINELPEGIFTGPVLGSGNLDMDYRLIGELDERYTGAFAMVFNSAGGIRSSLIFAYILDHQGLRLEHIPSGLVSGNFINRRSSSPLIIYFSPDR